MKYIINI